MPTKTISALLLLFYFSCANDSASSNEKNTFSNGKITKENNGNPYKKIGDIPVFEKS